MVNKSSKMLQYVNWRMKVTIQDSRTLVGTFLAFDKHMNLVLGDCEEFRRVKSKQTKDGNVEIKEEKRMLGLVLLRGENVVSLQVEAPPQQAKKKASGGRGQVMQAGRGMPMPGSMAGLGAPVGGIGGPPPGMMMPAHTFSAPPVQFAGRGGPMGMPPPGMPPAGMPPPGMMGGMPGMPPPAGFQPPK